MRQFTVIGRAAPTEETPVTPIYRMRIFARDEVVARSRFWYFMRKLQKLKRVNGQLLECKEIFEARPTVARNYGVWVKYDSRTNTHNIYKEFRDVSAVDAAKHLYSDMAGRHSSRFSNIQIVKLAEISASECKRPTTTAFHKSNLRFPQPIRKPVRTEKKHRTVFQASRPKIF
ncbi:50S ribosomal protein L18Ae/60S ribosomal protein L20 and L18a [Carpediemonas membranifera]|uniref:60S ribosomal protein L18a n=1 Tax=Carpediemonas membranifera TaxID=201153 RepID=A0A8J6DZ85_9EUKA|nr:50S ribosomal protein L18Ae/60S ribosomal protein L20 and L18a [Carpediemonas membranifera]KAG9392798.1 50S ribosomal protein L18Ae/60S ribosomal protein L20 and L18a [Carpediemonas membranifera]|eukprot:KAG9390368.1 50S ribosomal protein L18Ae/60S ribosomal protein L20 and L18a [Carpediemonas membranifera]